MIENVNLFCHSSIRLKGSKIVYIDPYQIKEESHDADFIMCTHTHYDHYSPEDIEKVKKNGTIIIAPADIDGVTKVIPNVKYELDGLKFETTYAYNIGKKFHPKDNQWVGYIIELDGKKYYIAGDTDNIPEIANIKCDIAFLPVGGTYTMTCEEAAKLSETIKAQIIVPTHYGSIVGDKGDGNKLKNLVKNKEVAVIMEE